MYTIMSSIVSGSLVPAARLRFMWARKRAYLYSSDASQRRNREPKPRVTNVSPARHMGSGSHSSATMPVKHGNWLL